MKNTTVKIAACVLTGALTLSNMTIYTDANNTTLPAAGATITLKEGTPIEIAKSEVNNTDSDSKSTKPAISDDEWVQLAAGEATGEAGVTGIESVLTDKQIAKAAQISEDKYFSKLVIADVNDYVNIRSEASEESDIVGKLYDESVGEFLAEKDGWYQINSGSVEGGWVKGEYVVTGEEAIEVAKQVGKRIATVRTETLFIREEATTETPVMSMAPEEDQLTVIEEGETEGWIKVSVEEGEGYVSTDYVELSTEFVKAESKAEEEARIEKEEAARRQANVAADKKSGKSSSGSNASVGGSGRGSSVASFALQFVGNPYVYGGTSLTNGADCSGFTMAVYNNFGISLPHSSGAQRGVGYDVGGLANAQPGDLVCYSGHVGLYIGGGQIVHASTAATGIKVSNASYRQPLSVRRIF